MKSPLKSLSIILLFLILPASSMAQVKLLYNHIGYEPDAPKPVVILTSEKDKITSFSIIDEQTGLEVDKGVPVYTGPVDKWRDWHFWKFNFDGLTKVGTYTINCVVNGEKIRSYPFLIQEDVLERNTLSDVVYYFKGQRSSGLLDKADRSMTFLKGRTDTVDVHGGWYDATGDYGKHLSHLTFSTYFNPQQINLTVWSLFETFKSLEKRENPSYRQYKRRLLDEAMYGADFLYRMKTKEGSFLEPFLEKALKRRQEIEELPLQ